MPSPRGLLQQLDRHLHRSGILPPRARLLVAVSGGADSVALLRLLLAVNGSNHWKWTLAVGHVDHGIRGKTSHDDARFVKALARSLELPYAEKKLRLRKSASEADARAGRLAALHQIAVRKKCEAIVYAHHADDQAETVMLRLLRGTGLHGLAGMAAVTNIHGLPIVRPLLSIRRAALREHLLSIDQPWQEDETNATDTYLRNRLRSSLMPLLEKLSPAAVDAITRTAHIAGEAQKVLEDLAADLFNEALIQQTPTSLLLHRKRLQQARPVVCAELLRQSIADLGGSTEAMDYERTQEAVRMIQSTAGGKSIQLGRGVSVRTQAGVVRLERAP